MPGWVIHNSRNLSLKIRKAKQETISGACNCWTANRTSPLWKFPGSLIILNLDCDPLVQFLAIFHYFTATCVFLLYTFFCNEIMELPTLFNLFPLQWKENPLLSKLGRMTSSKVHGPFYHHVFQVVVEMSNSPIWFIHKWFFLSFLIILQITYPLIIL